ncbi:MFS transporter [Stackebrandtia nassauensis]|uniref:Major facilitator superfamily MFS_1 n=1 Tax=Stackebrandtia nassauensis (strain DSM 44728 / CIP 108903 / NRRL B-16338 / NBRC 102104 / LLR-40K-21) TaxID=446470 RepID=D3QBW2_STANL|nr:MFS transporter [Stackebrandtia nassauensis]ADD44851.1 major facilitator superfamily MFS_1 [Stackebrandtia nassauensis DSM 44728]
MTIPQAPATPDTEAVGTIFTRMPLNRRHLMAGFALFFAFVIEAWEMLILSYIASDVEAELQVGDTAIGFLISAMFFGMIPGALAWGVYVDRKGRKPACVISLAAYGVISAVSALSPNYWTLWSLRLLSGVALAGILVTVFLYFEELIPVKYRGRATVFLAAGWPFGTLIAVGVASGFLEFAGWRWVIVISSLSGLWALVVWKWVPESPYWLVKNGRIEQARAAITWLSNGAMTVARNLTLATSGAIVPAGPTKRKLTMFTLVQIIINFSLSWGYWGLQTWLPGLLAERNLSLPDSYGFIALSAVFMLPGYFTASYMTGKFGRKKTYLLFVLMGTVGGLTFAYAPNLLWLYVGNFLMSFFAQGAWGVWDTWLGEIYPTAVRGKGYSIGITAQRVANAIAPTLIGFLVASAIGFTPTVVFIEAFFVIALIFALWLPETEGAELD